MSILNKIRMVEGTKEGHMIQKNLREMFNVCMWKERKSNIISKNSVKASGDLRDIVPIITQRKS